MSDERNCCAFGEPLDGPHPLCNAETERGIKAFWEAVARGEYDADGYTPAEAKAREKRLQAQGRLF